MKEIWLLIIYLIVLYKGILAKTETGKLSYENLVIAGEFPDSTVIRVGVMYYVAGTSSDFAPIYPLYEMSDLVNWKQSGLPFFEIPALASKKFWAPELYFKDGTFYLYYVTKRKTDGISFIGISTTKKL